MTTETFGELFEFESWPRPLVYNGKRGTTLWEHAKKFLRSRPCKLIVSQGQIYSLHSGVWRSLDPDLLAAEVQKTNEPELTLDTGAVHGIVGAIRTLCLTEAKPYEWIERPENAPDPSNMILFNNGILDFDTKKLWKYDGRFFATGRPMVDYIPGAECPRWLQAISEWFEESSDASGSVVDTLQEFFGYAMTTDTSLHVILALLGSGRAGKTTIVEVLSRLCGEAHTKSVMLSDLSGDHGLEGLHDARLVIIPDAADAELHRRSVALSRIKAISGGDKVSINPKGVKQFTARVPARLILVANRHPKFLDESGALAMRELPVMFTRSFEGDKRKDPNLIDKLTAELPGIANWAVEGLTRLRLSGRFTEGDALRRTRVEIENQQSHMALFARQCLSIVDWDSDAFVSKATMFEVYEAWHAFTRIKSNEVRNREQFKVELLAACARHGLRLKKVKANNSNEAWLNVAIKPAWLDKARSAIE